MKLRFTFIFVLLAVIISSCDDPRGHELSDYKNASTADSLMYYYIQLKALEYWERAENDTNLRSREERDKFLEGVKKGIGIITEDENYNRGVRLGVRLAYNLYDFEKKYDVDLNEDIMLGSLRNALQDGRYIPAMEDQNEFYRLREKMRNILKDKKRGEAARILIEEAKNRGLQKVSDNLYYKIHRKGEGRTVRDGDLINISLDYERLDGDNLGLPSPITVTVGAEGVPMVMDRAYKLLSHGSSAVFATTAYALFGSRTKNMGLDDDEVVIVSMILNDIITPMDENHPGSATL